MIKIKYNNSDRFYDVSFSRTEHTVTLTGDIPISTAGFTTWRMDGVTQLGDFSTFTTVYHKRYGFVSYSDDGSVYQEPKPYIETEYDRLIKEKSELEQWLRDHDYIGTKIATGRASISDYQEEIALMIEKANRINEIDNLLNN